MKTSDNELDRGTRVLVDDLLAKPVCYQRGELLHRARRYRYHDYKSDDALNSITLVKHLKGAGYHDLAQNAADGKYDQQRDASDEWMQTSEGQGMMELTKDPKARQALDKMLDEAKGLGRYVVPNDGPPEPGEKGQA